MTDNLDDFKRQLGRELVAAAKRRDPAARPPQRSFGSAKRPLAATAALVVVAMTAAIAISFARSETATAQVFEITRDDGSFVLTVVDIIDDPDKTVEQLEREADIKSEIFALPVPAQLVGQIIGIGSSGDISAEPEWAPEGYISKIILPSDFDGSLLVEYGRPAKPEEFYVATVPDPICAELRSKTPSETIDQIRSVSRLQRYQTINERNIITTNVAFESIDPTYGLTDISYLSIDSVIVTYAADPEDRPPRPNCG